MIFYIILCLIIVIILAIVIWGAVTKWKFIKRKGKDNYTNKKITIAILAGGPPKEKRQRFLEIKNGKPTIQHSIDACTIPGIKLCVVISGKNSKLEKYLNQHNKHVKILKTPDEKMMTSLKFALYEDSNDTILLHGDIYPLKKKYIIQFIDTKYKNAIVLYNSPKPPFGWGGITSPNKTLIRRGDITNNITKISNSYVNKYLSMNNLNKAKEYWKKFGKPIMSIHGKTWNENIANHTHTWLDYVFFFEIWANKNKNNVGSEKGAILINSGTALQDND